MQDTRCQATELGKGTHGTSSSEGEEFHWYMLVSTLVGASLTIVVYIVAWAAAFNWLRNDPWTHNHVGFNSILVVVLTAALGAFIAFAIMPYKHVQNGHYVLRALWWTAIFSFGPAMFWIIMVYTGMSIT